MSITIQQRGDSAANWARVNPVLKQREIGLETDTASLKVGDGVTAWNSLAYWYPGGVHAGSAGWLILALPALVFTSITRNVNEAVTSASVLWPDGTAGTWTTDVLSSAFPGAVDAYHVTYGTSPVIRTVTQPQVTRDTSGAVTAQPAVTVT